MTNAATAGGDASLRRSALKEFHMDIREILEKIEQSDMVLVGLGEEFDDRKRLSRETVWRQGSELLQGADRRWLKPAWNEYFSAKLGENAISSALDNLLKALRGKNYYIVSVSTNSAIARMVPRERLVMPCGSVLLKQCTNRCEGELREATEEDRDHLRPFFTELEAGKLPSAGEPVLGRCSQCGAGMVFNNICAERYNERGYLDSWNRYAKWLQGTLNRRLLVLELGVRMQFPTVIRWPFERVVLYNRNAYLCRINEDLFQLPEELASKGCGISKNTIDWLRQL